MKTLVFYAVWGEVYVDRFLNYALPTQLTPGNLFALPEGSTIKIATRESDVDRFLQSKSIAFCKKMLDVEVIGFPNSYLEQKRDDKYATILRLQNYALKLSKQFDAIIFGYADALWSEGSYRNAIARLNAGYDIVLCVGLNVAERQFTSAIEGMWRDRTIDRRMIEPRNFSRIVRDNLHIVSRSRLWDHPHMNNYPSFLLWNVKETGILVRAFHLHPVVVRVRHGDPRFFTPFDISLDEGFVPRLIQHGAVPYVSQTSDEMFVGGLLGDITESHLYSYPLRPPNIADVVSFAERSTSLHHRQFFEQPIRIVTSGGNEEAWQTAERSADYICAAVLRRLYLPDDVVKWETPAAYAARMERRTRIVRAASSGRMLTWQYIKTADRNYLKAVALYYFDLRGAAVMTTFGIGRFWPGLRRNLRLFARSAWRSRLQSASEWTKQGATTHHGPMLDHVVINTSLWQIVMVIFYLTVARSKGQESWSAEAKQRSDE